jgi:hypothetical protein
VNPLRWLKRVLLADGEPREPRDHEIVLLSEVDGEGTAELWRGMLEQRGIHSIAKNLRAIAYTRHGSPWAVYVQYGDLSKARELLGLAADVE